MTRIVWDDGTIVYTTKLGFFHRLDGPAFEHTDGWKEWWISGKRHRLDGPAIERANGYKEWRVNDKLHRLDGPAIEYPYGSKEWYVDGKRHRLDGPAMDYTSGYKAWWINGKYHRLDGPAIEYPNGHRRWCIYGQEETCRIKYTQQIQNLNAFLKFTLLQNKSRKFNEWLFDPDHYAGKWHKKNMLRDFQVE